MEAFIVTLKSHVYLQRNYPTHVREEFLYMLEGANEDKISRQRRNIAAGRQYFLPLNHSHVLKSISQNLPYFLQSSIRAILHNFSIQQIVIWQCNYFISAKLITSNYRTALFIVLAPICI
jgi:hypothetical protein